jgi:hypothetical protein
MGNTIKQVSDSLGRIFRYMLPGLCVVIAPWLSHPSWFPCIDYSQPRNLLLLAIIARCLGNIWYVFHRYTVHQLMDVYAYWRTTKIKNKAKGYRGYLEWLIGHIPESFRLFERRPKLMDRPTRGVGVRLETSRTWQRVCSPIAAHERL